MALRTGTITQQTRGARDKEKTINDLRKGIIEKRNEIKKLVVLLHTLTPQLDIKEHEQQDPTTWRQLKKMAKDTIDKLTNDTIKDLFVRPTRTRVRTYAPSGGKSRTQQHMKDETDINMIIKRHAETGNISHLNPRKPLYMDCTKVTTLQAAIHLVEEAEDNFATLPAEVRKACNNDPVQFMDMLYTQEGTAELSEAGLEYAAEPAQPATDQIKPSRKPKTIPAQQLIPPTETAAGDGVTQTIAPQGGE